MNKKGGYAYKDDDYDLRLQYWYALYPNDDFLGSVIEFDVRDLPAPDCADHADIIKNAIDCGCLAKEGINWDRIQALKTASRSLISSKEGVRQK